MSIRRSTILVLSALLVTLTGCGRVSTSIEQDDAFAPTKIATQALSWNIETLDVTGMPYGPVAMASGSDGTHHIAFYENVDDVVTYVSGQSASWRDAETVGSAQNGVLDSGSVSMVLDGDGVPRIGYYAGNGALVYATRADGAWPLTADVVSPYATYVSLAVGVDGTAHVVFTDGSGLHHAEQTSDGWSVSTVLADPESGDVVNGAVALDGEGHPQVAVMWTEFVYPSFWAKLGYAEAAYDADGRITWSPVTVVAAYASATSAGVAALALDGSGHPHIAYRSGYGHLTYVTHDGSAWGTPELVDEADSYAPSIALDGSGDPHVAYLVRPSGASTETMHYAVRGDTGWSTETVDEAGDAGAPSLVVDAFDRPHIGYTLDTGTANTLRYATVAEPVADHVVTNGTDGGAGSLRQAVADAPAGATITFDPSITEVAVTSGSLVLDKDLTIAGPDEGTVTLRGNGTASVVYVSAVGVDVELRNLTITGGRAQNGGGVMVVWPGSWDEPPPSLSLVRCTVAGNDATVEGGGIYVEGNLYVEATTVRGNTATAHNAMGGGIAYVGTDVDGSDPYPSSATIVNSTITGNAADFAGGIENYNGALRILFTTITDNTAARDGGGVYSYNDPLTRTTFKGTVVVGNTSSHGADDVLGSSTENRFESLGYNVIGAGVGQVDFAVDFVADGDLTGVTDAGLLTLADNGGPTQTHALTATSPALDRVPPSACTDLSGAALVGDQRGVARPQGANCDSGSFELEGGPTTCLLYVTVAPEGSGTVAGAGSYDPGATATLTATPADHWQFSHWSGDLDATDNPVTFPMDASKTVVANFTQVLYPVAETLVGEGSVTRNPPGTAYPYGTSVELTAVPEDGWGFSEWTGDVTSPFNPESLYVDGSKAYTAHFIRWYTLKVDTVGSGVVDVDPAAQSFPSGHTVTLTATPAEGWHFAGWSGDLSGTDTPATLTMDADKSVTATFAQDAGIELLVTAQGSGEVMVEPAGPYAVGDIVTLTAIPASGWFFQTWSGALSGSANPATLTIAEGLEVTAVFQPIVGPMLSVTLDGAGRVSSEPAGIDCRPDGGPCLASFPKNTRVTLQAVPETTAVFLGWSGAVSGSASSVTVRLRNDAQITAHFGEQNGPLVTIDPTGSVRGSTAIVSGSLACASGSHDLQVSILQAVTVKGVTQFVTASTTILGASCGQPWTATLVSEYGRFTRGEATVTVTVGGVPTTAKVQLR
jgi:uncharacterized repeat protein (TIGR02543 family)